MSLRVAINGFGRIGRNFLRAWFEQGRPENIQIVVINDRFDAGTLAHLLAYDSTHGRFAYDVDVAADKHSLIIDGIPVQVISEENPKDCPWSDWDIDIVLECTGQFRRYEEVMKHIEAGAKQVMLAAVPVDSADAIIVYGVNHEQLNGQEKIISSASCTSHCLAPLLDTLHENFTIKNALMMEIHAYTSDQHLIDHVHQDLRRSRAAAQNVIPTTSTSIVAIQKVLPELAGLFDGYSMRVPVQNIACVDLTLNFVDPITVQEVNESMQQAVEGKYAEILGYNNKPLVSSDFSHCSESAVFDSTVTRCMDNTARVLAWYDNEWGYVCRLLDLLNWMAEKKW